MKLPKGYTVFNAADHIKTKTDITYFLDAACEGNDPAHIVRALRIVIQVYGIDLIAKKVGLTSSAINKELASDNKLKFATFIGIINALGLNLAIAKI